MKNMIDLVFNVYKVTFHPYRTASVRDRFIEIDRYNDEARQFEKQLAEKAGVNMDNHTAYTLELFTYDKDRPAPKLHVMCSDAKISIGTSIEIHNW